jgi:Fur family transcriptional regulator, ferric uptake regulator
LFKLQRRSWSLTIIENAFAFAIICTMERQTRQQRAVWQVIADSGRALNPQEVLVLAQQVVPSINLSTVYRQLKNLQTQGRLLRVQLPGQAPRFEAAQLTQPVSKRGHSVITLSTGTRASLHHHHFHCVACEQVFPLHACPGGMDKLVPRGYEVQRHDLTLHGRCPTCMASAA